MPNTLFAILDVSNPAAIDARLSSLAPWPYLKLAEGQWLIVAPAATTTKELSDRLGMTTEPSSSNGIVLRVENYYGRNSKSIWEWISTKQEAELGAVTTV